MSAGTTLNLSLALNAGTLTILPAGGSGRGTYSLYADRITSTEDQSFGHDKLELNPGDRAVLAFGGWKGNGSTMPLSIDRGNKGTFDEVIDLTDDN